MGKAFTLEAKLAVTVGTNKLFGEGMAASVYLMSHIYSRQPHSFWPSPRLPYLHASLPCSGKRTILDTL